jgi:hypothetical protein
MMSETIAVHDRRPWTHARAWVECGVGPMGQDALQHVAVHWPTTNPADFVAAARRAADDVLRMAVADARTAHNASETAVKAARLRAALNAARANLDAAKRDATDAEAGFRLALAHGDVEVADDLGRNLHAARRRVDEESVKIGLLQPTADEAVVAEDAAWRDRVAGLLGELRQQAWAARAAVAGELTAAVSGRAAEVAAANELVLLLSPPEPETLSRRDRITAAEETN